MKALYVIGILFAGALSMGCVAQAGTDDSSQAEGLTADQVDQGAQVVQQQAAPTMKQRVQRAPQAVVAPLEATGVPQVELGLTGLDPSGNVQDDGDGKEPDPHPWHVDTARTSH
jgi:hypothetical protein